MDRRGDDTDRHQPQSRRGTASRECESRMKCIHTDQYAAARTYHGNGPSNLFAIILTRFGRASKDSFRIGSFVTGIGLHGQATVTSVCELRFRAPCRVLFIDRILDAPSTTAIGNATNKAIVAIVLVRIRIGLVAVEAVDVAHGYDQRCVKCSMCRSPHGRV